MNPTGGKSPLADFSYFSMAFIPQVLVSGVFSSYLYTQETVYGIHSRKQTHVQDSINTFLYSSTTSAMPHYSRFRTLLNSSLCGKNLYWYEAEVCLIKASQASVPWSFVRLKRFPKLSFIIFSVFAVSGFCAPFSHFRLILFSFHFWMKTSLDEHESISVAFMFLFNWLKNERKTEAKQNHSTIKNRKNHLLFFHYLTRFKLCACNYFAFVCLTVSFAQSKLEFVLFSFVSFYFAVGLQVHAKKKYVFPVWHAEKWKMVFFSLSVCILFFFFFFSTSLFTRSCSIFRLVCA